MDRSCRNVQNRLLFVRAVGRACGGATERRLGYNSSRKRQVNTTTFHNRTYAANPSTGLTEFAVGSIASRSAAKQSAAKRVFKRSRRLSEACVQAKLASPEAPSRRKLREIRMILAYHSIFSMYGFWLPNDPRGSGSDYIASWELFRYGPATKTNSRRSVAAMPLPPNWRREAQTALFISAGLRDRPPGTGDQPRIRRGRRRRPVPDLRLRDPPGTRPPRHRRQSAAASARWSAISRAARRTR